MATANPKLAVFIDCENASARLFARFLIEKPSLQGASIKRVYGTPDKLKSWKEFSRKYRFEERPTTPTKRKNATDFAMVIDCIHLLHTLHFQEAWLVTSDADFVQLAKHMIAHGTHVVSVGKNDAPKSLRTACDEFVNYSASPRPATTNPKPRPAVAVVEKAVAIFKSLEKPAGVNLSELGKPLKARLGDQVKGYGGLSGFLKICGPFSVKGQTAYLTGAEANKAVST